jgi:hypothetical protein
MSAQLKQGIHVAVCADHGVWLDKGKIEELTRSVRERTQRIDNSIRRGAVEDASEAGAASGMVTGWLLRLFH